MRKSWKPIKTRWWLIPLHIRIWVNLLKEIQRWSGEIHRPTIKWSRKEVEGHLWGKWLGSREEWPIAKTQKYDPWFGTWLDSLLKRYKDGSGPPQKVLKLSTDAILQFSMWDLCVWRRFSEQINISVHAWSFPINWLGNKRLHWLSGFVCRVLVRGFLHRCKCCACLGCWLHGCLDSIVVCVHF